MQNPKIGDRVVVIQTGKHGKIMSVDPSSAKNGIMDECAVLLDGGRYETRHALELNAEGGK